MSMVFCTFNLFHKGSASIEDRSKEPKRHTCRQIMQNMFSCFNRDIFKFGKVRKYLVKKSTKASAENVKHNKNTTSDSANINKIAPDKLAPIPSDDKLSKKNHLAVNEGFPEKVPSRAHSVNGEEASLTQSVIAQIEHDNRKAFEWRHNPEPMSRGANGKSAVDRNRAEPQSENSIDPTNEQVIKSKLSAPLSLAESDKMSEEPIYDVPPSKSLVNLNLSADEEVSLQKQHHIQLNNELAYFHTSSPNILLKVENEESIYDTPSTRSLAA